MLLAEASLEGLLPNKVNIYFTFAKFVSHNTVFYRTFRFKVSPYSSILCMYVIVNDRYTVPTRHYRLILVSMAKPLGKSPKLIPI